MRTPVVPSTVAPINSEIVSKKQSMAPPVTAWFSPTVARAVKWPPFPLAAAMAIECAVPEGESAFTSW